MRRIGLIVLMVVALGVLASAGPWTEVASLNVARVKARACVVDGKIYVIGGTDPDKNPAPVEVFDPRAGVWEILGPSPENVSMPCVAAVGGTIYVLAGRTLDKVRLLTGYMWTPGSGELAWTPVPGHMSMAHGDGACAVIGTKIYLISGEDDTLTNEGEDYVKVVDVLDTTTLTWSTAAPITPHQREDFDAVAVGNKIVCLGGQGGPAQSPLAWLDIYDAATDTWTFYEDGAPFPWEHPRLAAVGGTVYALTGKGEGGFTNMRLDLETMTWQRLTPPPVPVFECAVVALDGKIYVIGGKDLDGNVLNKVWVYDPQAEE